MNIRKATVADIDQAWRVRKLAIQAECQGVYPDNEIAQWANGELPDSFMREIEQYFYVAEEDGEIVGLSALNPSSAKVYAVFTRPDMMGKGVAKALLVHIENKAKALGLSELVLDSTLNAAPFYHSCGFHGEEITSVLSPRGARMDCIPMKKAI